jgi:hypothetical protein
MGQPWLGGQVMRRVLTRVRSFVLSSVGRGTVILFGVLVIGAVFLWRREISYAHPGPAIALALLAVVVLVIGLVISALQAQEAQKTPSRGPRLTGLELFVERWKNFGPEQHHSEILHQQFLIALSLAQLTYPEYDEIRFVKYFSGFKIRGGAFLFQPGQDAPLVLKFDKLANIEAEIERYKHCVAGRLGLTPGEPLVPAQQYGTIDDQPWGAITYNLIGASRASSGQVYTFDEFYRMHDDALAITDALNSVFEALSPWWTNQAKPDCGKQGRRDLYGEYDRLTRKQSLIEKGIAETGQETQIRALQSINANHRYIDLGSDLELRNPLNWIRDIFLGRKLAEWIKQHRQDSIVHGDLHAGNILISEGVHGPPRAWLIDFPHVHVGPTIQDIARLEADLKFGLLEDDTLKALGPNSLYGFETILLPESTQDAPAFSALSPGQLQTDPEPDPQVQKAYEAVQLLRKEALKFMIGNDARPYYLALLHTTMPALYYRNRGPWQKLYTFISAALLCERLGS